MSEITIVTAFYDIGRGTWPSEMRGRTLPSYQHRDVDTYFQYFETLAKMKNPMVIYTEPHMAERIKAIRVKNGFEDRTVVLATHKLPDRYLELKGRLRTVLDDEEFWSQVDNPHHPEYWNSSYVLVNLMKAFFVSHAVENGYVKTELAAWIDFGYCRAETTLPKNLLWEHNFDPEKIHLFTLRPIEPFRPILDVIKTGDVYTMGCHIVAGSKIWAKLETYVLDEVNKLLEQNLTDDDQTFLLLSFLSHPTEFELHPVDPRLDWFIIFKQFNEGKNVA